MKHFVGLICLIISTTSLAETLYIRDTLYLPLRAEPQDASELSEANTRRDNALAEATASQEQLRVANDDITRITALSTDAINLAAALETEQQRTREQAAEIEALKALRATLSQDVEQRWFLIGGAVVFSGALIGFWTSRRIYHRGFSGGWGR